MNCADCEGRLDEPGLFGCQAGAHPAPDLAQRIVAAIEHDLSGRRGLRAEWAGIDEDIQYEIRRRWAEIVRGILE